MENCVKIVDLTTSYGKSRGIIDINLEIKKGEIFGFIGPNGAGKSTTIRTILGFLFPSSGSVTVLGQDALKSIKDIKSKIGYLPSEVNFYSDMTVKGILDYSEKFYKKDCSARISKLVEIFRIDTKKKMKELSLGNKKKVAIVQAVMHQPDLLILDEPTNGLDPVMQSAFFDVLKEENKRGATIFFSSHILTEVQNVCNRAAIIKDGRILKVLSLEEFAETNPLKFRIETAQIEELSAELTEKCSIGIEKDSDSITFNYTGSVNEIISILNNYEIKHMIVTELSLEEAFNKYYK